MTRTDILMDRRILVLGLMLFAVGCHSGKTGDWKTLCDQGSLEPPITGNSTVQEALQLTNILDKLGIQSASVRRTFVDLAMVDKKDRYSILTQAAQEDGQHNWACPSLEIWLKK
jgi:hypothetical protein